MKALFLVCILSFFINSNSSAKDIEELVVKANVLCVGRYYSIKDTYLSVRLIVTNKSTSPKLFAMYSRYWQDSFVADKEYVDIYTQGIPAKNELEEVELEPNDSIIFNCIIRISEEHKYDYSFKIGLVYADFHKFVQIQREGTDSAKDIFETLKIRRKNKLKNKIYWSQELTILDERRGITSDKY